MTEKEILAGRFRANRSPTTHLRSVAYRMLGSRTEADDALRRLFSGFMRADTSGVDNFAGWLTTIVARVCLGHASPTQDAGRSAGRAAKWRRSRRRTIWSGRN